jgi:leucyl/phenylalanyl-tRNA--protein transferase
MLWHYANGRIPYAGTYSPGRLRWTRTTHRGVQMLGDTIVIPAKQRCYIFNRGFELRFNHAFERVVRHCADRTRDPDGATWLDESLVQGYLALRRLGFAYSFEAWRDGELAGGGFGVQLGASVSVDSMFHLVDNASKAAYVLMLLRLRDRGFAFVDVNEPTPHFARWGAEWVPGWRFDRMRRDALTRKASLDDATDAPALPWRIRAALPAERLRSRLARILRPARRQTILPACEQDLTFGIDLSTASAAARPVAHPTHTIPRPNTKAASDAAGPLPPIR